MLSGIRRLSFSASKAIPIFIKKGTIVNYDADVQVLDGKIVKIAQTGQFKPLQGSKIFDASNKFVIPSCIETHLHLQMLFMGTVSQDCFDTETSATLDDGTTFLLDLVVPKPGESLLKAYEQWRSWADEKVHHDFGLDYCITWRSDQVAKEMAELIKLGFVSFKFFLAYKGLLMINDMIKYLERCKESGALSIVHAENGYLIDNFRSKDIEAEATHRTIVFANEINVPLYVVHLIGTEAAEEVIRPRQFNVFGETLASTLGIDGTKYLSKNWEVAVGAIISSASSMNTECKVKMIKYLSMGSIHTVGTDNCTFSQSQKRS